jgi:hypothetical protein
MMAQSSSGSMMVKWLHQLSKNISSKNQAITEEERLWKNLKPIQIVMANKMGNPKKRSRYLKNGEIREHGLDINEVKYSHALKLKLIFALNLNFLRA